ncbi:MAG: hypothetical protein KIT83_21475 [Bryobacterales bacterium]|nr:hypothetical protein [Bryobacterales bacterium]
MIVLVLLSSKHFGWGAKAMAAIALVALLAGFPVSAPGETMPGEAAQGSGPSAESASAVTPLYPVRTRRPIEVSGRISSGFNEAFQLTLGGLFSQGSNFQNCATVDVKNLFTQNGTLRFSGILHLDTKDASRDWIGTVNYLQPLLSGERNKLVGTVGLHVWQFPSVLNGKTDTVVDSGLAWTHSGPLSFTLDANVKTLATGPNRKGVGGQIYYFRGVTSHPLVRKPKLSLALQHGPSYTYSNRFYGVNGHRVIRYEAGAVVQYGSWGMDVIFRPQVALQRGIPENRFWGFNVFYTFKS